jgi:hypothetical protein
MAAGQEEAVEGHRVDAKPSVEKGEGQTAVRRNIEPRATAGGRRSGGLLGRRTGSLGGGEKGWGR